MSDDSEILLHATTVAWAGNGVLILGKSGAGKSSLALHLMALGCDLVADDRTVLCREENQLIARCPEPIQGQIEAHSFGILQIGFVDSAKIACVVDLDKQEAQRLPSPKSTEICGVTCPVFHKCDIAVLPFALLQYLKGSSLLSV